jgi:dipeptidyl aminopeptidase/acylaminoacyl peptidase
MHRLLALLLVLVALPAFAEEPDTAQDVAFQADIDGTEQRYVVVPPEKYEVGQPVSVLVVLHGHGSDRWQFVRQKRDECRAARDVATGHGLLLVSPDYRAKTSWMGPKAEADLVQILAELRKKHRVEKLILSGGSMGGTGALTFTALHPDLVDGVVALNATANLVEYANFQDAIAEAYGGTKDKVPDEYRKRSAEFFPEKFTMPLAVTTSGKDTAVPPQSVQRLIDAVRKTNESVLLIHRPEAGHVTNYDDTRAAFEFVIGKVVKAKP